MAGSSKNAGRVIRVSSDGVDEGGLIHELFAVAVNDDRGALDAFHAQFAVYETSAEIVGPILSSTIGLLQLPVGRAVAL